MSRYVVVAAAAPKTFLSLLPTDGLPGRRGWVSLYSTCDGVIPPAWEEQHMELGAFSISLAVENLEASRVFYEKFGFEVVGGDPSQNWQVLRNGSHTIGLFQGMFERTS